MNIIGSFINHNPTKLSDLQNDTKYIAIYDYILDASTVKGNSSISINNIIEGSIITNISLKVNIPFVSNNTKDTIEVITDSGEILMDKSWNDPNIQANYSVECSYTINGNQNEIIINHSLSEITKGSAILRIELYAINTEYEELLTVDNTVYTTIDSEPVEVPK